MADNTVNRRKVLAKLGLAAGAAYMAPAMLSLSQARASGYSAPSAAMPRCSKCSQRSHPECAQPSPLVWGFLGPVRQLALRPSGNRRPHGMTFQQWWLQRFGRV